MRATPRRPGAPGALKGMRLGVIRESMVYPPGSKTEEPIVDAATKEIKTVLGGHLGVDAGGVRRSAVDSPIPTSSR